MLSYHYQNQISDIYFLRERGKKCWNIKRSSQRSYMQSTFAFYTCMIKSDYEASMKIFVEMYGSTKDCLLRKLRWALLFPFSNFLLIECQQFSRHLPFSYLLFVCFIKLLYFSIYIYIHIAITFKNILSSAFSMNQSYNSYRSPTGYETRRYK